ncbi:DUF2312 domain-containing protein [Rhizobium sp. AG207R]|uniref:DUF2312 domain-containing protein n=1 Tax=Rhizobium sp. AG207R TaxID=2802287 RepID=UPI0022AC384D|nr:DUF2312 domain-containing protein [Rhizobium sp. AG207R]MCZ3377459.1 DUF2312 domain-containing protein [Rhizobium sp. AG207R]
MTADKQLKIYIDRVLRLKEEQDALGDDVRDVYAEAKAEGYDKTVMGKLVAHLRKVLKQGEGAVAEAESVFDTYLQAYHRASGTPVAIAHTHEDFDPATGEVFEETHQRPSTNDEPSPEAGPQAEASPAGTGAGTLADREGHSEGEAASVDLPTNSEIASASQGEAEAPSAERVSPTHDTSSAAANTGGDHVTVEPTAAISAGALVNPAPAIKHRFRPNCQHRDHCKSGTADHCHSCRRAIREGDTA